MAIGGFLGSYLARRGAAAVAVAGLLAVSLPAVAVADTTPPAGTPATVTAVGLPTAQINGVVWSQAVVGNTVYVGGNFSKARPAGTALGSASEVGRTHLMAYDIRTGVMTSFAPTVNGQVLSVTASPDGSRLFVGGDFTTVNGTARSRVAAFDTATGALVTGFTANTNGTVRTLDASAGSLYVGGDFSTLGGQSRPYVGSVSASTGAVAAFRPAPSASVTALTLNPSGSKVVVGGRFAAIGGAAAYGLAAVDPVTGAQVSWPARDVIKNAGTTAAITALTTDADSVYGTAYVYPVANGLGNFEGTFRADGESGNLVWAADCHGDSYGVYAAGDAIYSASHAHYCGNTPDGFYESNPKAYYRANAFSKAPSATPSRYNAVYGYPSFAGQPAASLLHWYPDLRAGTITGQDQAAWNVSGNSDYVAYAGEFLSVNGTSQQGLVRFAKSTTRTNNRVPQPSAGLNPSAVSVAAGTVDVGWQSTWDYDNKSLTYTLVRTNPNGTTTTLPAVSAASWPGVRPVLKHRDTGLTAGATYRYQVTAADPLGNTRAGTQVSVVVASAASASAYGTAVAADDPEHWWRLGDASGTVFADARGAAALTAPITLTGGTEGAAGDGNRAVSVNGTVNDYAATEHPIVAPQTFTVEAWVKTSSTTGGRILGFGDRRLDNSRRYATDRQLYLTGNGAVSFSVRPGDYRTITSAPGYNDDAWHHVVATVGAAGMTLYVDGAPVASDATVTSAQDIMGHWRVGADTLNGVLNRPATDYLTGAIDEAAVYHRELTPADVQEHFTASGRSTGANRAPVASFTSAVTDLAVSFDGSGSTDAEGPIASYDWDFGDGATATGATASHDYTASGTYQVALTVTDGGGATATSTRSVAVGDVPNQLPTASFASSVLGERVSVNGSASTDPDGTVASYAWDFGDGATATGAASSHAYAAAGTYQVRLTVTDDDSATATTTSSVVVASVPPTLAADDFFRLSTRGWGTSDVGGVWSSVGSSSNLTLNGSAASARVATPGATVGATLSSLAVRDQDITTTVSLDRLPAGGSAYLNVIARGSTTDGYRGKLIVSQTGSLQIQATRTVASAQTTLASGSVAGITLTAGAKLKVRVQTLGASPTTVRVKVWRDGTAEPAAWNISTTDATPALQVPGGLGILGYITSSVTNVPVSFVVDDIRMTG